MALETKNKDVLLGAWTGFSAGSVAGDCISLVATTKALCVGAPVLVSAIAPPVIIGATVGCVVIGGAAYCVSAYQIKNEKKV